MLHGTRLLAIASIVCCAASSALASDRDICGSRQPTAEVAAACTRIIAAPETGNHDRAIAAAFRGEAERGQGDVDGALTDYNQALTVLPENVIALNGRAIIHRNRKQFDLALADLDKAIGIEPGNAELYNTRGITYRQKGDPRRAIEDLNQAIKLAPKYPLAFNNRGCHNRAELKSQDD